MGQLRLIRESEWFARLLNVRVFIDDIEVGKIPYNDYRDFKVSDGKHKLFIKVDILKSRNIDIDITSSRMSIFKIKLPSVSDVESLFLAVFDGKNQISFDPISTDTRSDKFA